MQESGKSNPSPQMPSRQQYVTELSQKIDEWDQKAEEISRKAEQHDKGSALLEDLFEKQAAAHECLEEVQEADESMWEELKQQASVASQDYQDVLERAAERFKVEGPRNASHESQRQHGGSGTQSSDQSQPGTTETSG